MEIKKWSNRLRLLIGIKLIGFSQLLKDARLFIDINEKRVTWKRNFLFSRSLFLDGMLMITKKYLYQPNSEHSKSITIIIVNEIHKTNLRKETLIFCTCSFQIVFYRIVFSILCRFSKSTKEVHVFFTCVEKTLLMTTSFSSWYQQVCSIGWSEKLS